MGLGAFWDKIFLPKETRNLQKINELREEYNKIVENDRKSNTVGLYNKKRRREIYESMISIDTKEYDTKVDLFCSYYDAWENQQKRIKS